MDIADKRGSCKGVNRGNEGLLLLTKGLRADKWSLDHEQHSDERGVRSCEVVALGVMRCAVKLQRRAKTNSMPAAEHAEAP